jgi:hypothetical protein
MSHPIVTGIWAAIGPWLAAVLGLQLAMGGMGLRLSPWARLLVPGACVLGLLLVPLEGLTVARWMAGLVPHISLPLSGLLAVAVWERASGRPVWSQRDWDAGWRFGAVGGLVLYPLALGVGSVDPYEWGWRFGPLSVAMAVMTGWLIWRQNRFGYLLLAAVLAFQLDLLESSNYWDYLLDPTYTLASLIALAWRGAARLRPLRRRAVP